MSQPSDYYESYEEEDSISSTTSENNIADETINKSSQKTLPPTAEFRKQGSCKVEIIDKKASSGKHICDQIIQTQGSTHNFATYLGSHRITKNIKSLNPQALVQSKIEDSFRHSVSKNTARIEQIEIALVKWIVDDFQPFFVVQNLSFIQLIKVLDPYYDLPSKKQIKLRIIEGYNLSFARLKEILNNE
ncbi:41941_t:CDS:2, partial [Gigaspora margarita]